MSEPDLLRAILIDPYDDTPRLIYADWLEEMGRDWRANEIRGAITRQDPSELVADWQIHHRGFIDQLKMTINDFMRYGPEWFKIEPITGIMIKDKRPGRSTCTGPHGERVGCWRWWAELETSPDILDLSLASNALPVKIFSELKNQLGHLSYPTDAMLYRTEADAMEALSQACVAYGRKLAGLPPLKV